jgi:hypothetical protein
VTASPAAVLLPTPGSERLYDPVVRALLADGEADQVLAVYLAPAGATLGPVISGVVNADRWSRRPHLVVGVLPEARTLPATCPVLWFPSVQAAALFLATTRVRSD